MAICTILEAKIDERNGGMDCRFNGYLEDFLAIENFPIDANLKSIFTKIDEIEPNTKICVDLRDSISNEAISNQIIRYKDVFKLQGRPLVIPYLLYLNQEEEERALLVVPYYNRGYIEAKGLYYSMTEPGAEYVDCKNEIVAVCMEEESEILDIFNRLFKVRAGSLQREIDNQFFKDYSELQNDGYILAKDLKEEFVKNVLPVEERQGQIREYVTRVFFIKKVLYVQYMVNKKILNEVHEGNIKKQRNQAKANADAVEIYSFAELWRFPAAEAVVQEEVPTEEPDQEEIIEEEGKEEE